MPQEQTDIMLNTTQADLKTAKGERKVRPNDKVKIRFIDSKFHAKPDAEEDVHPVLAEKLISLGRAEYASKAKSKPSPKQAEEKLP